MGDTGSEDKTLTRVESDSFGKLNIPVDKYYGANTQRALLNFEIGNQYEMMPRVLWESLCIVKKACAIVNKDFGLDEMIANAISDAADSVLKNEVSDDQFPVKVWQSPAGTPTNMNMNEVLAYKATEVLGKGKKRSLIKVHPNDHVNRSQSTNDSVPTACNIAVAVELNKRLIPNLQELKNAFAKKACAFESVVKTGRTHLQDATPVTLGQELSGYVHQLTQGIERVKSSLPRLYQLPIGATAVGTGITAYEGYSCRVVQEISRITGYPFKESSCKFEGTATADTLCEVSGALNVVAASLMKISNDIRLMASGPRCGLAEIKIPENEAGSSIMPGKVNPTQCDIMSSVCAQVMGNHVAVTIGCSNGHFELNIFKPMIVHNVLRSIRLLGDCCKSFTKNLVEGMEANPDKINQYVNESLMLVTALNHKLGYDKCTQIAKYAHSKNTTLKKAALKLGYVTEEDYDKIVVPMELTKPSKYEPPEGGDQSKRKKSKICGN